MDYLYGEGACCTKKVDGREMIRLRIGTPKCFVSRRPRQVVESPAMLAAAWTSSRFPASLLRFASSHSRRIVLQRYRWLSFVSLRLLPEEWTSKMLNAG